MKYYKFINKNSGAQGHLPKITIDKILANANQAKTIEILYECDSEGNKLEENAEVVTATDNGNQNTTDVDIKIQKTETGTPEASGTAVRKEQANKWGGDDQFKRTGASEQSTYY